MTKIDVISGFLGAGKTTLIKKLLSEAFQGEKLVLIENEFGEISIDGGFLKESGVEISEMSSGCICCSLVGDFSKALKEVNEKFAPDRILIEPSGVGKLSDVIAAVEKTIADVPELQLGSAVTVCDASKARIFMKNFGEFYNNQVESARTIILSRTQNLSQDKLETVVAALREKNPAAAIITTPWSELDGSTILSAMEKVSMAQQLLEKVRAMSRQAEGEHHHEHEHHHDHGPDCDCGCHGHHADEVFASWGKETPKVFTSDEIKHILTELDSVKYGVILRAKGIVRGENGSWIEFDYVPEEYEVRSGKADYTGRLCVIGSNLQEEALASLFGL